GKTLIARAIANQAKATFIRLSGSDLIQRYMGESVHMVRELFELAREKSPSILFIDEIDAIGTQRSSDPLSGTQVAHAEILMQLLSEMDGFDNRGNVRIMAATNRVDMLDHALLRPGRFDRILEIPLPDADSRREIFRIHSAKLPLAADLDIDTVLGMTEGTTGAEIQSICREAAMFAIRRNADSVTGNDFGNAVAKVRKTGKPVKYTDIMYY
ncbi:MAG: AAA family ATPase, partial [Methanomicrobium sp.]|nr:AAA family ATPase [Methanomicrobium sp.]